MKRIGNREFSGRDYFLGLTGSIASKSYLIIRGLDVRGRLIGSERADKDRIFKVLEIDGIPHTVLLCKKRFVRALRRTHTATQAYGMLRQSLSDNDIRDNFYELWRLNKNVKAAKDNERSFNERMRNRRERRRNAAGNFNCRSG